MLPSIPSRLLVSAALASVSLLLGCSSGGEPPDPTSSDALKKAEPIQFGCTYTKVVSSGYGTSDSVDQFGECASNVYCEDLKVPASDYASFGGESYYSRTEYTNRKPFVGTCGDPQPIECSELAASGDACDACLAKNCCVPVFLCDHDPNCAAIIDCLNQCGDDEPCQTRCVDNGDSRASKNLMEALSCLSSSCSKKCGG